MVMVIRLGVPVSAAFNMVLFTESPSVETLAESVVDGGTVIAISAVAVVVLVP